MAKTSEHGQVISETHYPDEIELCLKKGDFGLAEHQAEEFYPGTAWKILEGKQCQRHEDKWHYIMKRVG